MRLFNEAERFHRGARERRGVADGGAGAAAGTAGDRVRRRRVRRCQRLCGRISKGAWLIATPAGTTAAIAAKAATGTIPVVFDVNDDPVKLGLVASLAPPGGNATGTNFFSQEVIALLSQLVPKAVRIAVLLNPVDGSNAETTLREAQKAARIMRLQVDVLNASTNRELRAPRSHGRSECRTLDRMRDRP
jgi:putative ABC transport system substrate-binding protein